MHNSRHRTRSGFALGLVLMILVLITVLGLVLGAMGATNLAQIRHSGEKTGLVHAANGGLHELMDVLYGNPTYGTTLSEAGSGTFSASHGVTQYTWTFDPNAGGPYCTNNLAGHAAVTGYGGKAVPPGMALLVVSATMESAGTEKAATVAALATDRYPYAIASDGTIDIADVSSVFPGQGHVRSNFSGGSPNIAADLVDGMTFSVDGTGSIQVDNGSGPQMFNEPPVALPDVPIQGILASWSAAGLGGSHPYGGPAQWQYSSNVVATTDSSGNLDIGGDHITAPATIYVDGDFRINGGAQVARGIHVFCTGDFVVNGSLQQLSLDHVRRVLASRGNGNGNGNGNGGSPSPSVSPSPTPAPSPSPTALPPSGGGPAVGPNTNFIIAGDEIRFNGGSGQSLNLLAMNGIRQNGASVLRGFFYVRNGDFELNGSHSVTGVVITRSGAVQGDVEAGNANVTYDPAVLDTLGGLQVTILGKVRTTAWWLED